MARLGVNPPPPLPAPPGDAGLAGEVRTAPGGGAAGVCRTMRGDGGWIEVLCGRFPCAGCAGVETTTRGESEAVGVAAGGGGCDGLW